MEFEIRPIVFLIIAVGLPLLLLQTKRERLLLAWVAATMSVQLFDTALVTNLPAGRIVGLIYLPTALRHMSEWMQLKPIKLWVLNFFYLLILAVFFGWIWPWDDITNARPYMLTAPGRSIVYTVRLISDFSLAIFIASQLRRPGSLFYLGRMFIVGTTATALAGISYLIIKTDLYYPITGIGEVAANIDRARGFSLEPRSLGLACAYGVMILLLGRGKLFKSWPILIIINLLALLITYSASSYMLLFAGVVTATLFFSNRERAVVGGTLLASTAIAAAIYVYLPDRFEYALSTLQLRFDPAYKLSGIPQGYWAEEIAYRLDVFDASALLFFLYEPVFALVGAGPGMVTLPASYYVPPGGEYSEIWTSSVGINSLPFHGLLLETSNGGVVSLVIWIVQIFMCWRAFRALKSSLADAEDRAEWRFGSAVFIIGVVFYIVQVSTSPVWSIIMAMGWSAYEAAALKTRKMQYIDAAEISANRLWRPGLEPRTE